MYSLSFLHSKMDQSNSSVGFLIFVRLSFTYCHDFITLCFCVLFYLIYYLIYLMYTCVIYGFLSHFTSVLTLQP